MLVVRCRAARHARWYTGPPAVAMPIRVITPRMIATAWPEPIVLIGRIPTHIIAEPAAMVTSATVSRRRDAEAVALASSWADPCRPDPCTLPPAVGRLAS